MYFHDGDSKRLFFELKNNDFNMKAMPHSFLEKNTV